MAFAEGDEKLWPEDKPKYFCLDPSLETKNENLAKAHPEDERLVKLLALRSVLSNLVPKSVFSPNKSRING